MDLYNLLQASYFHIYLKICKKTKKKKTHYSFSFSCVRSTNLPAVTRLTVFLLFYNLFAADLLPRLEY